MYLHPYSESLRDGSAGTLPAAEGLGPSEPLVDQHLLAVCKSHHLLFEVHGLDKLPELVPLWGPGEALRHLPHEPRQAQGECRS